MVVEANTIDKLRLASGILHERAFVPPTNDLKALLWFSKRGTIDWVVGYNNWIGKTVQMHVVSSRVYCPKVFVYDIFNYPFNKHGINIIFGTINSLNVKSISLAKKIGFKEKVRWSKAHNDEGDLVLMELKKENCKWIKNEIL